MLSEINYAACLQYSPRGQSELSRQSREVTYAIKRGRPSYIERAAQRTAELANRHFADWFTPETVLVPVPRSTPLKDPDSSWVPRLICQTFLKHSLGNSIAPCIVRTKAVRKSAYQSSQNRPTAKEHYESFRIEDRLLPENPILVLVDDVVTKGATLIAACSRVAEFYPEWPVRAFALIRTRSHMDIDCILEPFQGSIRCDDGVNASRKDR